MTKFTDLLKEEFSVNLKGKKFRIKMKPNTNPTKLGIRIQFESQDGEEISSSDQGQIESSLQNFLNKAFEPYKMSVNSDPDVPNEAGNVIGFYLPLEQLENFVKKALKKVSNDFKKPADTTKNQGEEDSSEK